MKVLTINEIKAVTGATNNSTITLTYVFEIKQNTESGKCFRDFMLFSNSTDINTQEQIIKFVDPIVKELKKGVPLYYDFRKHKASTQSPQ